MRRKIWLVVFAFVCISLSLMSAQQAMVVQPAPAWQAFKMNAQYRGGIKKGFTDIGCGVTYFSDLPNGNKQIATQICAVTPDKKKQTYAFKLNMEVAVTPGKVNIVSKTQSQFEGFEEGGSSNAQVEELMALWVYLRDCYLTGKTINPNLVVAGKRVKIKDKIFGLKKKKSSRRSSRSRSKKKKKKITRQISISWEKSRTFKGKFFLRLNTKTNVWKLTKFRFNNKKVSVSLIKTKMDYINTKFAPRDPYKTWVFQQNTAK